MQEVEVVGCHQRHTEPIVQLEQSVVDLGLNVDTVPLNLEVVVVTEDVHELARRRFGAIVLCSTQVDMAQTKYFQLGNSRW